MSSFWMIWLAGSVLLVASGVLSVMFPRYRLRAQLRQAAWSAARAAITVAEISRDAASGRSSEAEQLLAEAEAIAAAGGGRGAARAAARYARRADRLWRAVARG